MAVACQGAAGAGDIGRQPGGSGADPGSDAAARPRLLLCDLPSGHIAGCGQLAEVKGYDQEGRKTEI